MFLNVEYARYTPTYVYCTYCLYWTTSKATTLCLPEHVIGVVFPLFEVLQGEIIG